MADFVAAQASVIVVPSTKGFHEKLKAQLKKQQHSVPVDLEAKTAKFMAEVEAAKKAVEADPVNLRVKVDEKGVKTFQKNITQIKRDHSDLKDKFRSALVLNIAVSGMSLLPALGSALGAVNASIVELSQSALVLPGILSSVAAAGGTALVGSRGLVAAFKAQSAAQKDAVSSARSQRDANRAVNDSMRDLARSIKDAKRNLEDLNDQLRDAPLDEAEAMLNLQEAQAEAADKYGKSMFDQQKDTLRVLKAESELAGTRKRNLRLAQDTADANAKGVDGADGVVAALQRLAKAQEDAAQGSKATSELADALARLSPSAREFVTGMQSLGGAFGPLREAVQERLFAGLTADVDGLARQSLPMLEQGMSKVASGINGNLRSALAALRSEDNQGFVEKIFGNTAGAQAEFDRAIKPMITGLLHLSEVGSRSLPRLAGGFGDVMRRFEAFLAKADADGSLNRWIDKGFKAMSQLGNSLINIGKIMNSVADAFTEGGGKSVLEWLETSTAKLDTFLKSAEGQQKLKKFFAEARAELEKWKPTLNTIPGMLKNVLSATQAWADIALPFLRFAGQLLSAHPGLVQAILFAYMGWKTISPIIGTVTGSINLFKKANAEAHREGSTLNRTVGAFSTLMTPGGVLATGIGVIATGLAQNYVTAQQDAAKATEHHRDMVSSLINEMDRLHGKMTQKGLGEALVDARKYTDPNERNGIRRDLVNELSPEDQKKFTAAMIPENAKQREEFLAERRAPIVAYLEQNWDKVVGKDAGALRDKGFTPDLLARAFQGDSDAVSKYEALRPGYGSELSDLEYGMDLKGLGAWMGVNKPGLPEDLRNRARQSKFINERARNAGVATDQLRGNNELANGKGAFKPGPNPFSMLPDAEAAVDEDGGGSVAISISEAELKARDPELWNGITGHGGWFVPTAAGGSIIKLPKDRAELYLDTLPGHAGGGLIRGPGSGTSDSILSRLSDGEFVVRAASVNRYGPGLLHALNAGTFDPSVLPGFDGGGPVVPGPDPFKPPVVLGDGGGRGVAPGRSGIDPSLTQVVNDPPAGFVPRVPLPYSPGAPQPKRPVQQPTPFSVLPVYGGQDGGLGALSTATGFSTAELSRIGLAPGASLGDIAKRLGLKDGAAVQRAAAANRGRLPGLRPYPGLSSDEHAGSGTIRGRFLADFNRAFGVSDDSPAKPAPGKSPGKAPVGTPKVPASSPHGGGGSPGPGNGVPHGGSHGGLPGPVVPSFAPSVGVPGVGMPSMGAPSVGMPSMGVPMSGFGGSGGGAGGFDFSNPMGILSNMPDNLQPQNILMQIGDILLGAVLGFFGIDPTYFNIGKRVLSGFTSRGGGKNGLPGNPYVQDIFNNYPGAPSSYLGTSIYGGGAREPYAGVAAGTNIEYGSGGFPQWVYNVASSFGLQPTTYPGHQESGGTNKGIDWSGSPEAMRRFADYVKTVPGMEQVIYEDPRDGTRIGVDPGDRGANQSIDDYYASQWAKHRNHVHTRMSLSIPLPGEQNSTSGYGQMYAAGYQAQYDSKGGAEQWRPLVQQIVASRGLGQQWVDPLVRQIATESGGDPKSFNGNDSNGRGGTQQVMGLFNFLPSTFTGNGGTDIWSPADQINTAITYVTGRYGTDANGIPNWIGQGHGFKSGGLLSGPGTGRSDSILARVSNGEYIVNAGSVAKYGRGFLESVNSGKLDPGVLPGFDAGGQVLIPGLTAPVTNQAQGQLPPPVEAPSGVPVPDGADQAAQAPTDTAMQTVGDAMGGIGSALSGAGGAASGGVQPGASGPSSDQDPRAVLGAAPKNLDHNTPWLQAGIEGGFSQLGSLMSSAISAAGGAMGGPAGGAGASAAGSMASAGAQIAGQVASGAVNILSSLLVGTATQGTTQNAYGAPVLPQGPPQSSGGGPGVVNNYGDIHTANYDEFYRGQQRREAQQQAPVLPMR